MRCRQGLILARKEELSVLQLVFLFISQVNLNRSFRLFFNFFCREEQRRSKLTLLRNTTAATSLDIPPHPLATSLTISKKSLTRLQFM